MQRMSSPIAGLKDLGLAEKSWLRREAGGGVRVYTSPSSGTARTLVSVPGQAKLGDRDVENVRAAFKQHFGAAVTQEALRSIDQRLSQGKEIRGEHIRSAAETGEQMFAEGFNFKLAKEAAEGRVGDAGKRVAQAEQNLGLAESIVEETTKRYDLESRTYGSMGGPTPTEARVKVKEAETELQAAKANHANERASLDEASARLAGFKAALSRPLHRGEDRTHLAGVHKKAKEVVAEWQGEVEDAKATYDSALAKVVNHSVGGKADPAARKQAREELDQAGDEYRGAKQHLESAERRLATVEGGLAALQLGPQQIRLQVLLDHVGDDPRFAEEINRAEGLGSYAAKSLGKDIATGTVKFVLAPVAWISAFAGAISSEDQERRLGTATKAKALHAVPLARGLAASMAQHAEVDKYKQGIQGTVGFVLSGVAPVPHGGALGMVLSPVTNAASHAIAHGAASQGLTYGVGLGVGKAVGLPTGKIMNMTLGASIEAPAAIAMPVIPALKGGKPVDLPLADPRFAQPFLAYLGPAADKAMLANPDPAVRQREERRLEIRREMFGTADTEDLRRDHRDDHHDLDVQIVAELDRGEPGAAVGQASPLRVLYCGLGWLGQQTPMEVFKGMSQ